MEYNDKVFYASPSPKLIVGRFRFKNGVWRPKNEAEFVEFEGMLAKMAPTARTQIRRVDPEKAAEVAKKHMASRKPQAQTGVVASTARAGRSAMEKLEREMQNKNIQIDPKINAEFKAQLGGEVASVGADGNAETLGNLTDNPAGMAQTETNVAPAAPQVDLKKADQTDVKKPGAGLGFKR